MQKLLAIMQQLKEVPSLEKLSTAGLRTDRKPNVLSVEWAMGAVAVRCGRSLGLLTHKVSLAGSYTIVGG